MEQHKQKYPHVDEETLSGLLEFNDKKMHKELEILNEEIRKRKKAENNRDDMRSKCLHLESQLRVALEELEKIKIIKEVEKSSKDDQD